MPHEVQSLLALVALLGGGLALSLLALLHFLSPEFQPSWRLISEYALGKSKWAITAFFIAWGVSTMSLGLVLWSIVTSLLAKAAVGLVLISGVGAIMGGLFDVHHRLHGLAFALGVPSLPIAAPLIGHHVAALDGWNLHSVAILGISHAVWMSLLAMGVAMAVMFSGFERAGIPMSQDAPPPDHVPDGVIAVAGYANRALVVCYQAWVLVMAWTFLRIVQTQA